MYASLPLLHLDLTIFAFQMKRMGKSLPKLIFCTCSFIDHFYTRFIYADCSFHSENNKFHPKLVLNSSMAAILDAILDFSVRHHLCQFMPAVLKTTNIQEHFGI